MFEPYKNGWKMIDVPAGACAAICSPHTWYTETPRAWASARSSAQNWATNHSRLAVEVGLASIASQVVGVFSALKIGRELAIGALLTATLTLQVPAIRHAWPVMITPAPSAPALTS